MIRRKAASISAAPAKDRAKPSAMKAKPSPRSRPDSPGRSACWAHRICRLWSGRADDLGKMHFHATMLTLACLMASAAGAVAAPDERGWDGPGWYITGAAAPAPPSAAAPDYVLLEGPHKLQGDCQKVYDRLYSPIGVCRFLDAKPIGLAG